MKSLMVRGAMAVALIGASAYAGALLLQVGSPETNPEAKALNASLVASSTACHEPAKSVVSANIVELVNGQLRRTPLKVVALSEAGTFAVIGKIPSGSVIDVAVSNPEYVNYQPRVIVRANSSGIQWAGVKRFYNKPPTDNDIKAALGDVD
jgi:hypothetical protein